MPVQATGATASAVRLSADSVTFAAGETSQVITVTVLDNDEDAPGVGAAETTIVQLEFGTLPESVTLTSGDRAGATIAIADDDVPSVMVSFGAAMYSAMEDGASATVTVNVTPAPERALTIPLTVQYEGGATAADFTRRFRSGRVRRRSGEQDVHGHRLRRYRRRTGREPHAGLWDVAARGLGKVSRKAIPPAQR